MLPATFNSLLKVAVRRMTSSGIPMHTVSLQLFTGYLLQYYHFLSESLLLPAAWLVAAHYRY